jgi:hypothetical protein
MNDKVSIATSNEQSMGIVTHFVGCWCPPRSVKSFDAVTIARIPHRVVELAEEGLERE